MIRNFSFNFLNKITIKNRLVLLTILVSFILFIANATVNCLQSYNNVLEHQLISETNMAVNTLAMYQKKVNDGELTLQQAKELAKAAIANMSSVNESNYLWIQDYNSTMIMHPLKPEMNGINCVDSSDKKGNKFFKALSEAVKKDGKGFVTYFWNKPNQPKDNLYKKLSFGKGFNEWQWIVGTGVYEDDIVSELIQVVSKNLLYSLIISVIVIIIANLTIVKSIIEPLEFITKKCLELANNDLSVNIPEDNNKTEIGDLTRSVSSIANNMRNLIIKIKEKSNQVNASSIELQSISETSSQVATQVAETIEQMSVCSQNQAKDVHNSAKQVSEIAQSSHKILKDVQLISNSANESVEFVLNGKKDVENTIEKILEIKNTNEKLVFQIDKLGNLGQEIGKIVELITSIASQTNLLALNAAIESARAGEHGKGFAVVAEEVKKLAEESAQAAKQITGMILQIQNESKNAVNSTKTSVKMVEEGVLAVNQVKEIFEQIQNSANTSAEKTDLIKDAVKVLGSQNDHVSQSMENISAIVEETAASNEEISASMQEQNAGMEELSASAQMLSALTLELNNSISVFRV